MDNSLKGLILAAGVVITCIVIGLGFYLSREAKNTSNSGANQMGGMNDEYQDVDLALYDGLLVSGKEVESLISKTDYTAVSGFTIAVDTGLNAAAKSYTAAPASFPVKGDAEYINPTAQFLGKVTKDKNQIITKVTFTQQ